MEVLLDTMSEMESPGTRVGISILFVPFSNAETGLADCVQTYRIRVRQGQIYRKSGIHYEGELRLCFVRTLIYIHISVYVMRLYMKRGQLLGTVVSARNAGLP